MAGVRAILFDFNGTISDDEPLLCSIYRSMFAEHGRPLTEAEYYATLAGNAEEVIIGGWLGVEGDELARLVRERVERYRALTADGATVPARAREAVRYAAARVPVGVVSSARRTEIEPVLAATGLAEAVGFVVSADDADVPKPAPDLYLEALRRLGDGRRPNEVVAIEDTDAGVASAVAAGLRCVGLVGTLPPERLAAADELADRLDVALVRRLLE